MALKLLMNLKGLDLSREKLKDFKNVVIVQIILLAITMLLANILKLTPLPEINKISETIFFAALGLYVFLLWDMLRNYTKSEFLLIGLLILIMGTFVLSIVVVNPFFPIITGNTFRVVTGLIMSTLLLVEISVIYYTILEITKRDLSIEERLWGAACIYLITAIAFGSVYEIVSIIDLEHLSMNVPLGTTHFMKSISYSVMILGGVDTPYPQSSELVANISAIEAVWGNLFIVFMVGRLLYK